MKRIIGKGGIGMVLYRLKNQELVAVKEVMFSNEKELQCLIESNLEVLFNLKFVATEFVVDNFRLDTVAFDEETNSFVIIEYKMGKKFSVVDQGYAYLNSLLAHKGDFTLSYNEHYPANLKRVKDNDWSQTKILFIARDYTNYQYGAFNNPDLPIDLLVAKKYENGLFDVEFLKKTNFGQIRSIETNELNSVSKKGLSKEIMIYTEEKNRQIGNLDIQNLYDDLREIILGWDGNIQIKPVKLYNSFKLKRNIVDIHIQKNALKLWINLKAGELNDPENMARDVSQTGHWGNGDYEIILKDNQNIEYIASLIKQAWKHYR